MEPGTLEWTTVMNRLERLEKQNHRMKQIGVLASILVGAVLLMGQTSPKRTVEANEFLLKDSGGRVRARLSAGLFPISNPTGNPDFVLIDAEGKERVRVGLTETGTKDKGNVESSLTFYNDDGKKEIDLRDNSLEPQLSLWGNYGGMKGGITLRGSIDSSMALFDWDGKMRTKIGFDQTVGLANGTSRENLSPSIDIWDFNEKISATLGVTANGPAVWLLGEKNEDALLGVDGQLGPFLRVSDKEGFQTTVGGTELLSASGDTIKTSAASVILFDKDKKVRWRTP